MRLVRVGRRSWWSVGWGLFVSFLSSRGRSWLRYSLTPGQYDNAYRHWLCFLVGQVCPLVK